MVRKINDVEVLKFVVDGKILEKIGKVRLVILKTRTKKCALLKTNTLSRKLILMTTARLFLKKMWKMEKLLFQSFPLQMLIRKKFISLEERLLSRF